MKYRLAVLTSFKRKILDFYKANKRDLPWRKTTDPYLILVSEIMLQQTQVPRVLVKYPLFIEAFPDMKALAHASTSAVLKAWQGMGYNRRALYLKKIAEVCVETNNGLLPQTVPELDALPGIGGATASSIAAFAYNMPTVFIETNIRRVFIHHFFKDRRDIDDRELYPLIAVTLDTKNPREWYYALMDYGSHLGKTAVNPNRRSRHYTVQTAFEGSDRQLRGKVLRYLLQGAASEYAIGKHVKGGKKRMKGILTEMVKEGFLKVRDAVYSISK